MNPMHDRGVLAPNEGSISISNDTQIDLGSRTTLPKRLQLPTDLRGPRPLRDNSSNR